MQSMSPISIVIMLGLSFAASTLSAADSESLAPPENINIVGAEILSVSPTGPVADIPNQSATGVFPGSNIRHKGCLGTRAGGVGWNVEDSWFDSEYERAMSTIRADQPQAFGDDVAACVMRKITWRAVYVDESKGPTSSAQAQDPNWSNYIWNSNDTISKQLDSQYIARGDAMMGVLVADQYSAQRNAVPEWFVERGHSFGDFDAGHFRNRMDDPVALGHIIDFYIAFIRKYGGDKRLQSVVLGEYFTGNQQFWPADFDRNAYAQGRRQIWQAIVAAAPLDDNGNRIAIYQTQPILDFGVSISDMLSVQMGVSASDVYVFSDGCGSSSENPTCTVDTHAWALQAASGRLPTMINGDSRSARDGLEWRWTGIANPFGLGAGDRAVASPQHIYWYYGENGVTPINSIFLRLEDRAAPQTFENMLDAVRMFGRGGSHAARWGAAPLVSK